MRDTQGQRSTHIEEEDASSSPSAAQEEEEDVRSDFFADFDQQAFLAQLDEFNASLQQQARAATPAVQRQTATESTPHQSSTKAPPSLQQQSQQQPESSEFYGTAIQILTHILGSSTPYPWLTDATPRAEDSHTPRWDLPPSSPMSVPSSKVDMQQLINTLVQRLGGPSSSSHRVREQDLTQLLQTLLAQQPPSQTPSQASHTQPVSATQQNRPLKYTYPASSMSVLPASSDLNAVMTQAPSSPNNAASTYPIPTEAHFADLTFPDDEDDDPDFLPASNEADDIPPVPSASAWSLAMEEVAPAHGTRARRREASLSPMKTKRGRPRQFTAEEAMERKRGRNREYMARQREKKLGSKGPVPLPTAEPRDNDKDRLVLEAENRFLRAELERLREENAQLRGREEMRAYAARMGLEGHVGR